MRIDYFICCSALEKLTNFSKAANSLYMTQSAFSKQINAMENQLGVKLFDRTPHGVTLTPAGAQIVPHVNAIIEEYNQIQDIAKSFQECQQFLRVASLYEMAHDGIVDLFVAFEKQRENIYIESVECSHVKMCELLKTQKTDIIIGYRELMPDLNGFTCTIVRQDALVVVINSRHPLAGRDVLHLPDLKNESFCLPHEDSAMFSYIRTICGHAGFAPWITKSNVRIHTIKRYINAGMRMTILPEVIARSLFWEDTFKVISLQDIPKLSLAIVADYSTLNANGLQFIQFLQDALIAGIGSSSPE